MINELVGLPDTWDAGHGQIPSSCRSSWATVSKNTSEMFILAEIHAQVTQNIVSGWSWSSWRWIYGKHDENLQENTELVKITALYAENVQWFWFLSVNTLIWWRIDCLGRLYFSCLTYIYMIYMKQWKFTVRFLGA